MTDLHGITVTPGIMAGPLRQSLEATIENIGGKLIESIRIDTTHFVCTEGRGPAFEKAREMNIPVVLPDWVKGCEREGRLVGVRGYYLDANPKDRQIGQRPQSSQQQQRRARSTTPESRGRPQLDRVDTPTTVVIPPTPERTRHDEDSDTEQKSDVLAEGPANEPEPEQTRMSGDSEGAPTEYQAVGTSNAESNDGDGAEVTSEPEDASQKTNGEEHEVSVESEDRDRSSSAGRVSEGKDGRPANKEGDKFDEVDL